MKKNLFIIFIVLVALSVLPAAKATLPAPILTIGRTYDKNEIHYFINTDSKGNLTKDPITLKWANFEQKNGAYEEMNWIKKQFGYKPVYTKTESMRAEFQFVSFDKKSFEILKDENDQFIISTIINNQKVTVNRIFIHMDGGSFWAPNILSAELYGENTKTKKQIVEVIKP